MELFHKQTKIDFMGMRKITASFSIIISIVALFFIFTKGLNYGLDFTGGTQLELRYNNPVSFEDVRHQLETSGFAGAKVTQYGSTRDILVKLANKEGVSE